jgi:hypothetical protein
MAKLAQTATDALRKHVSYELECIDRMYLNVYVPVLQTPAGVAHYIHQVLQRPMASTALLAPKGETFVRAIEKFVRDEGIDMVRFAKGQRKDDVTQQYLQTWEGGEGVMYVGKAQEKARTVRTCRKVNPETGQSYLADELSAEKSMHCCANGYADCRIRFPAKTGMPGLSTMYRCCKLSLR